LHKLSVFFYGKPNTHKDEILVVFELLVTGLLLGPYWMATTVDQILALLSQTIVRQQRGASLVDIETHLQQGMIYLAPLRERFFVAFLENEVSKHMLKETKQAVYERSCLAFSY